MRESDIEGYLVKCVGEAGGYVRKIKYIGHRGAPDRLVLLQGFSCFVELKAPNKKPYAHQVREHRILTWANVPVVVIDSYRAVERLVFEKRYD